MAQSFNQEAAEVTMQHLSRQLEIVMQRLDDGSRNFTEVKVALHGIETTMRHVNNEVNDLVRRVTTLEADFNQRKGERGVWSAVMNSKGFAWLAAVAAAAWAALPHVKGTP